MSQRRDKGSQKPPPTTSPRGESSQMAATYLPPLPTYAQSLPVSQEQYPGAVEQPWEGSLTDQRQRAQALASDPFGVSINLPIPSTPQRGSSNPTRRPPGAAPLADILLQDPTPSAHPSTSPQHPDLSPLRLHGDPASPERSRQVYFDPARNTSSRQQESAVPPSQAPPGYFLQAGPSPPTQAPLGFGFSASGQSSSSAERISPNDRDRLRLTILQQPKAARACGYGERDRRVIDPPPILQLNLLDYDPNSASDRDLLRSPFNMVHCFLLSSPTQDSPISACRDVTVIHDPNDPNKEMRRLMGSLTISPFIGDDIRGSVALPREPRIGTYFIFSDLSCRQIGLYRLQFVLTPVDMNAVNKGARIETITTAMSDVFEVYSAKDFPGMSASSSLTRELKRQGASVPIKKGNESKSARKSKKRGSDSDGSSSDGSDDAGMSRAAGKKPRS